ncbi:MAG: hypothetical protein U9N44_02495 [Chloroflexota bacterium]|nr:hypothetical protein [Chloroflexota bacterium]
MDATQRHIVLQTGRMTSPETLLWDMENIDGLSIETQRLDAAFLGGGVACFLTINMDKSKLEAVAEAVNKHLKRLKKKGDDDIVVLIGGRIKSQAEEIKFSDVQCRQQVTLKGKTPEKIKELLIEALAEGA